MTLIPAIIGQAGAYTLANDAGVHWQYAYDIHEVGSKSEARSGRLFVEGAALPDARPGDRLKTPWGTMRLVMSASERGWLLERDGHAHSSEGKLHEMPEAALSPGGTWKGSIGEWGYTIRASAMGTRSERRIGDLRYRRGAVTGEQQGDYVETPWGRMRWMGPIAPDNKTDYEQGFLLRGTYNRPLEDLSGNPVTPTVPVRMQLESLYLGTSLSLSTGGPGAHTVRLTLERRPDHSELSGSLTLDPNGCSLNAFGDPEVCTKMAVFHFDVTATPQSLADPRRLGRIFYKVRGERLADGVALIMYPHMERCYLKVEGQLVPLFHDDGV